MPRESKTAAQKRKQREALEQPQGLFDKDGNRLPALMPPAPKLQMPPRRD